MALRAVKAAVATAILAASCAIGSANAAIAATTGSTTVTEGDGRTIEFVLVPPTAGANVPAPHPGGRGWITIPVFVERPGVYVFSTCSGTATVDEDFVGVQGARLVTEHEVVSVEVVDDAEEEGTEVMSLWVAPPGRTPCSTPGTRGTIVDDETAYVSIAGADAFESREVLTFSVTLDRPHPHETSVVVELRASFADPSHDEVVEQRVDLEAGATAAEVSYTFEDNAIEDGPWGRGGVAATIVETDGVEVAVGLAHADIVDDEVAALTIGDASVVEGDVGTTTLGFPVHLSVATAFDFCEWATVRPVTADLETDVGDEWAEVCFDAGQTAGRLVVAVIGDREPEADETLRMRLYVRHLEPWPVLLATGTILDDDA